MIDVKKFTGRLVQAGGVLLRLPVIALKEMAYQMPWSRGERQADRKFTARHEAGHALLHLLHDMPITHMRIGEMRFGTYVALERLLGDRFGTAKGRCGTYEEEDAWSRAGLQQALILNRLAGTAATASQPYALRNFRSALQERWSWSDAEGPTAFVIERLQALFPQKFDQERLQKCAADVVMEIMVRLSSLLGEQPFRQALDAICDLFLELKSHRGEALNQTIGQYLETKGITQEHLEQMRQRLQNFNIDKVILEYFRLPRGG